MKTITSALLLSFSLYLLAASADISGSWTASFDTQIGVQNYTYQFTVDGETVTGLATSASGEVEIQSGRLSGNTLTFTELMTFQGMELLISYTGEVMGNEIHFTRDVAGLANESLVATRTP
jgi:hypothetical protein